MSEPVQPDPQHPHGPYAGQPGPYAGQPPTHEYPPPGYAQQPGYPPPGSGQQGGYPAWTPTPPPPRRGRSWQVPALVAGFFLVAIALAVVFSSQRPGSPGSAAPSSTPTALPSDQASPGPGSSTPSPGLDTQERRTPGDPYAQGRTDAPVVLVEYADFRCGHCRNFATTVHQPLVDRFVRSGLLRIEWRDMPVLGEESLVLARAGRAAAEQGKFWEYHDAVFGNEPPTLSPAYFRSVATRIGADPTKFLATMDSPAALQAIKKDFDEGQAAGVSGTPSFVVDGRLLVGEQSLDELSRVIRDADGR